MVVSVARSCITALTEGRLTLTEGKPPVLYVGSGGRLSIVDEQGIATLILIDENGNVHGRETGGEVEVLLGMAGETYR